MKKLTFPGCRQLNKTKYILKLHFYFCANAYINNEQHYLRGLAIIIRNLCGRRHHRRRINTDDANATIKIHLIMLCLPGYILFLTRGLL